jgi:hypothetical protein
MAASGDNRIRDSLESPPHFKEMMETSYGHGIRRDTTPPHREKSVGALQGNKNLLGLTPERNYLMFVMKSTASFKTPSLRYPRRYYHGIQHFETALSAPFCGKRRRRLARGYGTGFALLDSNVKMVSGPPTGKGLLRDILAYIEGGARPC